MWWWQPPAISNHASSWVKSLTWAFVVVIKNKNAKLNLKISFVDEESPRRLSEGLPRRRRWSLTPSPANHRSFLNWGSLSNQRSNSLQDVDKWHPEVKCMLGRQGQGHVYHKLKQGRANNEYEKPEGALNLSESCSPLSFNKHWTHDKRILSHCS